MSGNSCSGSRARLSRPSRATNTTSTTIATGLRVDQLRDSTVGFRACGLVEGGRILALQPPNRVPIGRNAARADEMPVAGTNGRRPRRRASAAHRAEPGLRAVQNSVQPSFGLPAVAATAPRLIGRTGFLDPVWATG